MKIKLISLADWHSRCFIFGGKTRGRSFGYQSIRLPMQETRRCGSISWVGRFPGGGNGNPLQLSCLENSMDRGAWWAIVHGVTKSWTQRAPHTHSGWKIWKSEGGQIKDQIRKYFYVKSRLYCGSFRTTFETNNFKRYIYKCWHNGFWIASTEYLLYELPLWSIISYISVKLQTVFSVLAAVIVV